MTDTPPNTPRDNATGPALTGATASGDLSGISEMFGLRDGEPAGDTGTRTGTDTVGRWVAATEGSDLPPDVSGRLVHGRYRLIAELGVGGMGVTYRAWDTQSAIPVVVKMPRREVRQDSEAMQRFAREIDAMLAVPHERIVPITDHGDDDGCPYVVMRFLPGGSLGDYRRWDEAGKAIRNPPGMLHFWLPGVAAALDHIHSKGMLHRDVKPGNIFLDGFLKPYLGDFGIAKVVDESGGLQKEQTLTATKMAIGTPEYMAPELFKPRSKPDGQADQYALAVTVYEMLSGEKPFKGDRAHIIVEHSAIPVPPLAAKVPGLPQSLCIAVERALSKNAVERFTTCSKFAAAVVADLVVLPPEHDTVRLLCPSCKNILKLPQKAAGRTGKCPRCREAMDVAADLGSLWLESEERGGGMVAADVPTTAEGPLLKEIAESTRVWQPIHIAVVVVAAVLGFIVGAATVAMVKDRGTRSVKAVLKPVIADTRVNVSSRHEIAGTTLTDAEFEALLKDKYSVSLNRPATLTDAQAEALAKYQGSLSLRGLTMLTDSQAESLAKHQGSLDLSGLASLTDAQAESLSKHQEVVHRDNSTSYGLLRLDGLTSLTTAQAESLAKHRGYLSLDGLTNLTDAQAEALAKHTGSGHMSNLNLNGLIMLSDAQAEAFAKHKGNLSLSGLKKLSDGQAEALAKHKGGLGLGGLTTLTESQAEALSKSEGSLGLGRLTTLTDSQVAALAKHRGGVLGLSGLTTLTESQAEALAKHQGYLSLDGLKKLTDTQAESLAQHIDGLHLNGSKHSGELSLNGLKTLTDAQAEALAKHKGNLSLNGLTSLTDAQAEALAKLQGLNLHLNGLTRLTDTQAEALAKREGHISLSSLRSLSDKAAGVLRARDRIWFPGKFNRSTGPN